MDTKRADCVRGAGRVVAAGRTAHRADRIAVEPQQSEQKRQHGTAGDTRDRAQGPRHAVAPVRDSSRDNALARAESRSRSKDWEVASAAAGNARITTRVPAGNAVSRVATRGRNRRTTACLVTEPPTALLTTNPARAGMAAMDPAAAGSTSTRWTTKWGRAAREPPFTVAVKSPARRSRNLAGSTGVTDRPRSGGQFDAALAAPSRQDGAASTGTHTQPKTMGLCPPTIVRLEGALGHGLLLGKYICGRRSRTRGPSHHRPVWAGSADGANRGRAQGSTVRSRVRPGQTARRRRSGIVRLHLDRSGPAQASRHAARLPTDTPRAVDNQLTATGSGPLPSASPPGQCSLNRPSGRAVGVTPHLWMTLWTKCPSRQIGPQL
jgi:plasmid stabilization system protein ParE